MAKWFYYNESGEKIEVTGGQLKGLAKAGMITPDTVVETGEGKSGPARRVKGLTFLATIQSEATQPEEMQSETFSITLPTKSSNAPSPFSAPVPDAPSPFSATINTPAREREEKNQTCRRTAYRNVIPSEQWYPHVAIVSTQLFVVRKRCFLP